MLRIDTNRYKSILDIFYIISININIYQMNQQKKVLLIALVLTAGLVWPSAIHTVKNNNKLHTCR